MTEVSERPGGPASGARRRRRLPPPLARWWERAAAVAVDAVVVGVVYLVLAISLSAAFSSVSVTASGDTETPVTTTGDVVLIAAAVVLALAYFGVCHGLGPGQTVGGRLLRIAVRDAATGRPLGYRRGLLRAAVHLGLYACLVVPGLVSDLRAISSTRRQTVPDRIARSVTVRMRRRSPSPSS